jgi:hypothetical protein
VSTELLKRSTIKCDICVNLCKMEAESTFEMSVNFYRTTRRYNPENSNLHTRRRENLRSYQVCISLQVDWWSQYPKVIQELRFKFWVTVYVIL